MQVFTFLKYAFLSVFSTRYRKLRDDAAEHRALVSIYEEMLHEVMLKSLSNMLQDSARARTRAENASGLIFRVAGLPSTGLPYDKWRDLSMQWNTHKWYREALLAGLGAENMVEMQVQICTFF